MVDEVDDLNRSVDDAELLLLLGEGKLEEAAEELHNDLLTVIKSLYTAAAPLDIRVEILEPVCCHDVPGRVKRAQHGGHG